METLHIKYIYNANWNRNATCKTQIIHGPLDKIGISDLEHPLFQYRRRKLDEIAEPQTEKDDDCFSLDVEVINLTNSFNI